MDPVRLMLYFDPMKEAEPASKALFCTKKKRWIISDVIVSLMTLHHELLHGY
jgi:hypothetical protein